ncbi:MAG: YncE family protein [Gammaproteobacteria bacterium]
MVIGIRIFLLGLAASIPVTASAEILALLNYESKPDDSLKELKMPFGAMGRKEGIGIIDVDPESESYGQMLMDIPLPPDLVAHHVFYNRDATKLYVTALGKPELRVIDMTKHPYRVKVIDVPDCQVGEDVVFSEDNKTWYATCMGSSVVITGDAVKDTYEKTIKLETPYPHGIAIHEGIDRMLLTSTVRASDLKDAGEVLAVVELSTGRELSQLKMSDQPSPSGVAPVEILFVPGSDPPVAWVTNMYGNSLWTATWNPDTEEFVAAEGFDFAGHEVGVPLEMYFSPDGRELYVTTANPGHLHFFDLSEDGRQATLAKTVEAGEGAHHVAFDKEGRYAWVQNSFINLPGMSEGSITTVNLADRTVMDTITTFQDNGFNPNCIVLLPEWNDPMGH